MLYGGYAGLGLTWGATLLPLTNIGLPFANTVNCEHSTGAVLLHPCPVLHLSLCLDILGMPVFMDAENRLYYSLNLLNWPFLTSCLMPPTMYDSTSVSCGATCMPLLDSQCCVHGSGFWVDDARRILDQIPVPSVSCLRSIPRSCPTVSR